MRSVSDARCSRVSMTFLKFPETSPTMGLSWARVIFMTESERFKVQSYWFKVVGWLIKEVE